MGSWGIEVEPDKPYLHSLPGKLHLTQATVGTGSSRDKCLLLCSSKGKSPIRLCSLLPEHRETCHLDLKFDDSAEFSVLGSRSIHIAGNFVADKPDDMVLVKKTKESEGIPELLLELIEQILQRLPVRPLVRFKCVCKTWGARISNRQFSKSHFDTTAHAHCHRRLLLSCPNDTQIESLSLESPLQTPAAVIDLPLTYHPYPYTFYRSGHGLMLVACYDENGEYNGHDLVWNPSTGFEQSIPKLDFSFVGALRSLIGFGYNQSKDEFYIDSGGAFR